MLRGTLLRSGTQLRLSTQLIEVPSGTVAWSKTMQTPVTDVFDLQDELSDRVIEALAIPLSARERLQLERDVPATARAYELYLRANHLGTTVTSTSTLASARDLYRACLQDDPRFAPAWARLGRIHRIMAKYGHGEWQENVRLAEQAFRRALELNPDLPLAHGYYTYFEIEELGEAPGAMLRLLERVRARAADPDLFAGLVTVLRFCGLYDASLVADARARRLDPKIVTSAHYTLFLHGQWEEAVARDGNDPPIVRVFSEAIFPGPDAALAILRELQKASIKGVEHHAVQYAVAALEGDAGRARASIEGILSTGFHDPEGIYFGIRALSYAGETDRAAALLGSVVEQNFLCHEAVAIDPWLAPLQSRADVAAALEESRRRHALARAAFEAAEGPRLLAMS